MPPVTVLVAVAPEADDPLRLPIVAGDKLAVTVVPSGAFAPPGFFTLTVNVGRVAGATMVTTPAEMRVRRRSGTLNAGATEARKITGRVLLAEGVDGSSW